jgi:hypothetical protein
MSNTVYDADGNVIRRTRIWRKPNGDVWFRRWGGDPYTLQQDRPATSAEEERIVAGEDERQQARERRRLKRYTEDLLATANGTEVVGVLVAADVIPPKLAKAAGWVPPP